MSIPEAAEYLGRPESFVRMMLYDNVVPRKKVGRRLFIYRRHLEEWLEAGGRAPDERRKGPNDHRVTSWPSMPRVLPPGRKPKNWPPGSKWPPPPHD